MNDDPSDDPALFGGKTRLWYGRWDYKYLEAAKHGASGAIVIHTTPSAGVPVAGRGHLRTCAKSSSSQRTASRAWWRRCGPPRTPAARSPRSAARTSTRCARRREKRDLVPRNVARRQARLPRSTHDLRHIDSANVARPASGERPGARPAGGDLHRAPRPPRHRRCRRAATRSTTAPSTTPPAWRHCSTIARAATLAKRPRRTLLFIAVTAEEQGLLGSAWYCRASHLPLCGHRRGPQHRRSERRWADRPTSASPASASRRSTTSWSPWRPRRGARCTAIAFPEKGSYYRSDQFSFAKIGVPGIYARGGPSYVGRPAGWGEEREKEFETLRYHQPSDEYRSHLGSLRGGGGRGTSPGLRAPRGQRPRAPGVDARRRIRGREKSGHGAVTPATWTEPSPDAPRWR